MLGSFNHSVLLQHAHYIPTSGNATSNTAGGVIAGYDGGDAGAISRYAQHYGVFKHYDGPEPNIGNENAPVWLGVLGFISY